MWGWGKDRGLKHPLDEALLNWTEYDPYRVRDLLNGGCLILGRPGSGKTSSSGRTLMRAVVKNRRSGGLILAAKPEDADDAIALFKRCGRVQDLIVFDPDDRWGAWRCNYLGCLKRPADVTNFITTLSDVLKRGDCKGGEGHQFYDKQEARLIGSAVTALVVAGYEVSAPNMHRFITTMPSSPADLKDPAWMSRYCSQVLDRGFKATKTEIQRHDFQLVLDFVLHEWASMMDSKTRGNILTGVQGTLFTLNTGLVKQATSGATNFSPQDALKGRWILCNYPPATLGPAGLIVSVGLKALVQMAVLERKAGDDSGFCVVWADEAHQFVTGGANGDNYFIAQGRSHMGALVYLTQSVSSLYASLGNGEAGKHQADSILAAFSHAIVHACDPVTAKWASSKLGRKPRLFYGGGSSPRHDCTAWDSLFGENQSSVSFNYQMQPVLEDQDFMVGLTGGPENRYLASAIVLKSGEPFRCGENYLRVTFSQK